MKKMLSVMVFLVSFALVFTGCGRDGGSGTPAATTTTTTTTIGGTAVNGLMAVSTVKVYSVDSTGGSGTLLATTSTDSTGKWTAPISTAAASGVVRVEVSGGSYIKESDTSSTITNTGSITAMVNLGDTAVSSKKTALAVTPISTFIDKRSTALAAASSVLSTAITTATDAIKKHIGITSDPLTVSVNLSDPTAVATNPDGTIAGLILGALTKEADILGVTDPGKLVSALADDFSDGVFDGKSSTAASITISGTTKLGVGAGSTALTAALTDYLDPTKTPNSTAKSGGLTAAAAATLTSKINTSVATSTATSSAVLGQANVSTSAAAALYTSGTTQKLYIAGKAKAKGLVIVDTSKAIDTSATIPANTTTTNPRLLLIQDPATTGCSSGNTTACYQVDGLVVMNNKTLLVLYSFTSPYLVFVDLATDQVAATNGSFNTTFTTSASFSGGSALVAGAIGDNVKTGAWIAAADGYYFVDMSGAAYAKTNTFPITAGYGNTSENFGADTAAGFLWAPNYNSYDYLDIASSTKFSADTTTKTAIGVSSPDHGAVDTKLHVGIVMPESGNIVSLIDFSKMTIDSTAKTFSIPSAGINKKTFTEAANLSGAAVDSASHVALLMYEWGSDVVVAKLDDVNTPQIKDYIYFTPGTYSGGDPHALAIGTDVNGKVIGYLPTTSGTAFILNLTNLLDSTKYTRSVNSLAAATVTQATTAKDIIMITY